MGLLSRRKFLNGAVFASIASVITINSVGGQEAAVSELTHLRVKIINKVRNKA